MSIGRKAGPSADVVGVGNLRPFSGMSSTRARLISTREMGVTCRAMGTVRNPRRHKRLGFWLFSWLLFLGVPVYRIDREQKLSELYHTAWTFKDGAPAEG